jgi:CRP-like cAMP-binding protein
VAERVTALRQAKESGMPQSHSSNLLLASLPPEDLAALAPHLRVIELPRETVLFEAGDTIKTIHFPTLE